MMHIFVYDTASGRVLATAQYNERRDGATNRAVGIGQIDPDKEYLPGGIKTARAPMPNIAIDKTSVRTNGEVATVTNVPNPATVSVFRGREHFPRASQPVTDGTAALTFDTPGTYTVKVQAFPHQDTVFQVEVQP